MILADQLFAVTGGSSGLGAACVQQLIDVGAKVLVIDLNRDAGLAYACLLGEKAAFAAADVTDEAALRSALISQNGKFGPLRGLIHCAGIEHAERMLNKAGPHDLDAFALVLNVNVIGTFNAIRLAADLISKSEPMEDGERGVIIATASVAAYDGQVGQAAYAASKGAVASMTLPIARDLARHGIRMMTIAPGVFDTPLLGRLPPMVKTSLEALVPFPSRLGSPDEFAKLALHIIENRMLNGEVIRLDGALRMPAR